MAPVSLKQKAMQIIIQNFTVVTVDIVWLTRTKWIQVNLFTPNILAYVKKIFMVNIVRLI